ncbi:MAG: hypothetical protein KDD11_21995 [Acidobacteria bacterium]|nr:hypothetical protein [Acidobacteriota bacterium]
MTQNPIMSHDAAWRALPWLANDTLEGDELSAVLDHLKVCAACRAELRFLPELRSALEGSEDVHGTDGAPAAFERLMARIDTETPRRDRATAPLLEHRRWRPLPRWGWAAIAAQAAVIVLLALPFLRPVSVPTTPGAPQDGEFHTLSSATPGEAGAGPRLRVMFEATTPEETLRGALLEVGGRIVGGPSAGGVYTVELAADALPSAAVRALRSRPEVALAEPVVVDAPGEP